MDGTNASVKDQVRLLAAAFPMSPQEFRQAVGELGLGSASLAVLLGMNQRTIERYFGGKTQVQPVVATVLRVAMAVRYKAPYPEVADLLAREAAAVRSAAGRFTYLEASTGGTP